MNRHPLWNAFLLKWIPWPVAYMCVPPAKLQRQAKVIMTQSCRPLSQARYTQKRVLTSGGEHYPFKDTHNVPEREGSWQRRSKRDWEGARADLSSSSLSNTFIANNHGTSTALTLRSLGSSATGEWINSFNAHMTPQGCLRLVSNFCGSCGWHDRLRVSAGMERGLSTTPCRVSNPSWWSTVYWNELLIRFTIVDADLNVCQSYWVLPPWGKVVDWAKRV